MNDSGKEPCFFHNHVVLKWKVVSEDPIIRVVFDCPALSEDKRCQIDSAPCPTEKIVEYVGLLYLRKASEFLHDHPLRRRP